MNGPVSDAELRELRLGMIALHKSHKAVCTLCLSRQACEMDTMYGQAMGLTLNLIEASEAVNPDGTEG